MSSPKLLLIDSNSAFLSTTTRLLQARFDVVGAFQDGAAALREIMALAPDIVLLEVYLGDYNGFEIARRIRLLGSKAKLVFLSLHAYPEFVHAARSMGASGYIFKTHTGSDLVRGVEAVAAGQEFFSAD